MKNKIIANSFRYALERSFPIMIGFFPVGIAYGILMQNAGYNFLWSMLTSIFVYAGSLQMLMVSFFTENIPLVTVFITSLLLNSRHIFYGISFVEKLGGYGKWKYFMIYGMSDEAYALLSSYREREGTDEKWVNILSSALACFYWVIFSALGGLIGELITFNTKGMDFALTALFVVILIEQIKSAKSKLPLFISLLSAVVWLIALGEDSFLLPSLITTVAVLIIARPCIERKGDTE